MKYFSTVVSTFLFSFTLFAAKLPILRFDRFPRHHQNEAFTADCDNKTKVCLLVQILNDKVQAIGNVELAKLNAWIEDFDKAATASNVPKKVEDPIYLVNYTKSDGTTATIGYNRDFSKEHTFPQLTEALNRLESTLWESLSPEP